MENKTLLTVMRGMNHLGMHKIIKHIPGKWSLMTTGLLPGLNVKV